MVKNEKYHFQQSVNHKPGFFTKVHNFFLYYAFGCISAFHLDVNFRTLQELFRMTLVNLVTLVVLKILDNLFSMQNSLNANNC